MTNLYSRQTIANFRNPRYFGEIKNPDGHGEAGNIICGDIMSLYLKITSDKDGNHVIADVKFKTYGCVAAIATSNVVAKLAKSKTIKEALKISKQEIVSLLHGLPPIKIHCSLLAVDALGEAIYQYLVKNKQEIPVELQKRHAEIEKTKKILEKRIRHLSLDH